MGDQIMPVSIPMDIDTPTPTKVSPSKSPSIQPFVLGKESQVAAIDSTSMTNLVSSRQKMPVWGNGRLEDNPNGWSMMKLASSTFFKKRVLTALTSPRNFLFATHIW